MDAEKYWRRFENSGDIRDYMSYRQDLLPAASSPKKERSGNLGIEGLCSANRYGTEDKQLGRI